MKNYLLRIEYIGKGFYGFQKQKNLPTVQGTIENALSMILRKSITVNGASRTDRGVNALNQYVNFYFENPIDTDALNKKLNSLLLTKGIIVKEVKEVNMQFHPRKSSKSKIYAYLLSKAPEKELFLVPYVYFYHGNMDKRLLRIAAEGLKGKHDFSIFASKDRSQPFRNNVCNLFEVNFIEKNDLLILYFWGDRFLYHMVRRMVYYLIKAGTGAIREEYLKMPFKIEHLPYTRQVLPPEPLFLVNVLYDAFF